MPEVKKISLGGNGSYPKATRRTTGKTSQTGNRTRPNTSTRSTTASRDTFQSGYHDPDMAQMESLRRRAGGRKPSLDLGDNYPKSGSKVPTRRPAPRRSTSTPTRRQAPHTQSAPRQTPSRTTLDVAPEYPTARPTTQKRFVGNYRQEQALIEAKKAKQAAYEASLKAENTPPPSRGTKSAKASKPRVKANKKLAAGGAIKVISGTLSVKGGVENIANGNYMEGGLQVAEGGVSFADGVQDINAARQGLSKVPGTKMAKGLNVAGNVLNAGMALYDTKQAYDALKSGNEVQASEEMGSALINAVSAFPPTALIGAAGGIADWAMAASGADEAMVRQLSKGKTKAYNERIKADISMARTLIKTETGRLQRSSRAEKQKYIRGLNGLRELKKIYAEKGDTRSVRILDLHVARVRKAWSKR